MGVLAYVQNHKTWTGLWVGFAIFWLIGFGYYCAKLDNVVFDGKPYYMQFRATKHLEHGRKWPAWLACPGMGHDAMINMTCQVCSPPPEGERPARPVCSEIKPTSAGDDHGLKSCMVFNNDDPVYEDGISAVNCVVNYTNTSRARIYVFDQQWPISYQEGKPIFPNGAVMHTLPKNSRSLLEIAREVYQQNTGEEENSFTLLDSETYATDGFFGSDGSFMMYWGNRVDKLFTQSDDKITTGYDFWYWIGFIGGVSFFCYSLHSIIYAVISIAFGWKEEEVEGFATLA